MSTFTYLWKCKMFPVFLNRTERNAYQIPQSTLIKPLSILLPCKDCKLEQSLWRDI